MCAITSQADTELNNKKAFKARLQSLPDIEFVTTAGQLKYGTLLPKVSCSKSVAFNHIVLSRPKCVNIDGIDHFGHLSLSLVPDVPVRRELVGYGR
jgi:hypothetical protein